jgi:hypothetical protein
MKTVLEKIKEEIKERSIKRNIPYDAFIYKECMVIIDSFKDEYKQQLENAYYSGTDFDCINGEDYYQETFVDSNQAE